MKKKTLLFTSILFFSITLTTSFSKPSFITLASTVEQGTDVEMNIINSIDSDKQIVDTFEFTTATLKKGNAVGKYIKIKDLSDSKMQKKINSILKADATAIMGYYDTSKSTTSFEMKVSGKYIKDTNLFIAIYTGDYNNKESAYPTNFYYVSVIDVENASRVAFTDKTELKKIKKAIQKGKFTCKTKEKELATAQKDYLMRLSDEELDSLLSNINFTVNEGKVIAPSTFMYKTKTTTQMSISAIHAIGDHIEISIKNSDLK